MDLRPASSRESKQRTRRRRMHQALQNLVNFLIDAPHERLQPLLSAVSGSDDAEGSISFNTTDILQSSVGVSPRLLRYAALDALEEKRRLRGLSRSFGLLHQQVLHAPAGRPEQSLCDAYRDAAVENMRKRWNVAFHEWCADAISRYF